MTKNTQQTLFYSCDGVNLTILWLISAKLALFLLFLLFCYVASCTYETDFAQSLLFYVY